MTIRYLPLKHLVDPRRPITYGIVQAGPDVPGGVRYIRPVDMSATSGVLDAGALQRTSREIALSYKRSQLLAGDLVVSIGPSFGKIMVVPRGLEGANLTQGTARVAVQSGHSARFVYWALQSHVAREHWELSTGGATFKALNLEPLARTPVPDVGLEQQRRIADFLDEQVALVDLAIALRQQQTDLARARFVETREVLLEGSGGRRTPLNILVDPSRPVNYGVLMPGPEFAGGVPLVEAGDVMRGSIQVDHLRRTDPLIEAEYKRSRLRQGDLVMAIRGSVGRVRVVPAGPDPMNVTRDAARISLRPTLGYPPYVRHAISTRRAQDWLTLRMTGSAVKGINIADLRKVPLAVPVIEAQQELAHNLDELERDLVAFERTAQSSSALMQERKQALITAAVTGQFDIVSARSAA